MFSSFLLSYCPIQISPKALLASKLAGALAVYFEVDPEAIESNLIVDAKVVLHQIRLKPQSLLPAGTDRGGAWLVGTIDEVVFSWKWGGSADGSTSFIREAVLTIRGAKLQVILANKCDAGEVGVDVDAGVQEAAAITSSSGGGEGSSSSSSPPSPVGYLDRYVQQIIDHLTLSISDVEIEVGMGTGGSTADSDHDNNNKMVIEVSAIQLSTLGRQTTTTSEHDSGVEASPSLSPLAQRLSVESLSAYILISADQDDNNGDDDDDSCNKNDANKLPLLDPMSYATSVKRVSGRRFLNFVTGLEIIGDFNKNNNKDSNSSNSNNNSSCVVIHAESTQVKVLAQLGCELLRLQDNGDDIGNDAAIKKKNHGHPSSTVVAEALSAQTDDTTTTAASEAAATGTGVTPPEELDDDDGVEASSSSTLFVLPLPSLILQLPNASVVKMPNCELRYRMDGSTFVLAGTDGIHIHHHRTIDDNDGNNASDDEKRNKPLLQLADKAEWSFDFVTSSFTVSRISPVATNATLQTTTPATTEAIAHLHWEEKAVKNVVVGLLEIERISHDAVDRALEVCGSIAGATSSTISAPSSWSVAVQGDVTLQVSGGEDGGEQQWVRASIASPSVVLGTSSDCGGSSSHLFHKLEMTSAQIGPTSFGDLNVSIPSAALDENQWRFTGPVEATVQSMGVLEQIQRFAVQVMEFRPRGPASICGGGVCGEPAPQERASSNECVLPMSLKIPSVLISLAEPKLLKAQFDDILVEPDCSVHMSSLRWWGQESSARGDDNHTMSGSMRGLALKKQVAGETLELRINQIEAFCLPGIFELMNPIMNASIRFGGDLLELQLTVVHTSSLLLLQDTSTRNEDLEDSGRHLSSCKGSTNSIVFDSPLPYRVRAHVEELSIVLPSPDDHIRRTSSTLSIKSIDVEATPQNDGYLALKSRQEMTCEIQGFDDLGLRARLEPSSLIVTPAFDIVRCKSLGLHIGYASFGKLDVRLPSFTLEASKVHFDDCVSISIDQSSTAVTTLKLLEHLRCSVDCRKASDVPASLTFPVMAPKLAFTMTDPMTEVSCADVHFVGRTGRLGSVALTGLAGTTGSCMSGSMRGLALTVTEELELRIDQIETFRLPGMFELTNPVANASVRFGRGFLNLHLTTVRTLLLLETKNELDGGNPLSETSTNSIASPPLPFGFRARVDELSVALPSVDKLRTSSILSVKAIGVEATPQKDGSLALKSHWVMTCQIERMGCQRVCVRVEPFSAILTPAFDVVHVKSLGMHIGPASFGKLDVFVPPFTLEASEVRFDDCVSVAIDQPYTAETTLKFLEHLQCSVDCRKASIAPASVLFPVIVPKVTFSMSEPMTEVSCTDVHVIGRTVRLGSVSLNGPAGTTGLCHGISCSFGEEIMLQVEQIQSLRCPSVLSLTAPILRTKVVWKGNALYVRVPTCCFIVDTPKASTADESTSVAGMTFLAGPLTIDLSIESLVLQATEDAGALVSVYPIHAVVLFADKGVSVQVADTFNVRFSTTPEYWLDARVGAVSVTIASESIEMESLTCSAIHVGPCSYGEISLDLPFVSMSTAIVGTSVICEGALSGVIQSVEFATLIQEVLQRHQSLFLQRTTSSRSVTRSTSVQLLAVDIEVTDLNARLQGSDIMFVAGSGEIRCSHGNYLGSDGTSMSVRGILGCIGTSVTARAEFIDSLYAPGVLSLQKPIKDITIALSTDNGLFLNTESVSVLMLDSSPEMKRSEPLNLVLPFAVTCNITDLHMAAIENADDFFHAEGIDIQLKPKDGAAASVSPTVVAFCLQINVFESNTAKICGSFFSGLYCGGNSIAGFVVRVDSAEVTAGFSSIEWKRMLKKGRDDGDEVIWGLPHASVSPFSATTVYRGNVVSSQTILRFSKFTGGPATTLSDIMQHLKDETLQQMPSFLSGAEVMGESVVDLTAKGTGRAILGASLKGSVVGSVGGIVVLDSIRGGLAHGKQARGSSVDDSYRFGDLTRGTVRAIKETAKATMQKEGRDSYQFGDFTRGAIQGSRQYSKDNKSRLGSAAGSSVGMVVGCALLGPVGLVAGSIFGGAAGANALADDDKHETTLTSEDDNGPQVMETQCETDLLRLGSEAGGIQPTAPGTFERSLPVHQPFQSPGNSGDTFAPVLQHEKSQSGYGSAFGQSALSEQHQMHQPASRGSLSEPLVPVPAPQQWPTSNDLLQTTQLHGTSVNIPGSCLQSASPSNTSEEDLLGLGSMTYYQPSSAVAGHSAQAAAWQNAIPVTDQQWHAPPQYQTQPHHPQHFVPPTPPVLHPPQQYCAPSLPPPQSAEEESGYRFGDLTRSVISKGKQKSGRSEKDSYKFGDFTRGLFGK